MFDLHENDTRKEAGRLRHAARKGDKRAARQARKIIKGARKARQ